LRTSYHDGRMVGHKLTDDQVRFIRKHYTPAKGNPSTRRSEYDGLALANKFNVHPNTIYNITGYRTYAWVR
jgi:hypothetical protein